MAMTISRSQHRHDPLRPQCHRLLDPDRMDSATTSDHRFPMETQEILDRLPPLVFHSLGIRVVLAEITATLETAVGATVLVLAEDPGVSQRFSEFVEMKLGIATSKELNQAESALQKPGTGVTSFF